MLWTLKHDNGWFFSLLQRLDSRFYSRLDVFQIFKIFTSCSVHPYPSPSPPSFTESLNVHENLLTPKEVDTLNLLSMLPENRNISPSRLLIINLLFPCYELSRVEANLVQLYSYSARELCVSLGPAALDTRFS